MNKYFSCLNVQIEKTSGAWNLLFHYHLLQVRERISILVPQYSLNTFNLGMWNVPDIPSWIEKCVQKFKKRSFILLHLKKLNHVIDNVNVNVEKQPFFL